MIGMTTAAPPREAETAHPHNRIRGGDAADRSPAELGQKLVSNLCPSLGLAVALRIRMIHDSFDGPTEMGQTYSASRLKCIRSAVSWRKSLPTV